MTGGVQEWVPFEWPESWASPEQLRLLEGTPFNCLLFGEAHGKAREAAGARGFVCPAGVRWQSWREAEWSKPGELLAIADGFWPELSSKGGDSEEAGPTGVPWLDANGWLIEMARARLPGSTAVWIKSDLPEDQRGVRWLHYELALLEAWAYGARRPLTLAAPHAEALARGDAAALAGWNSIQAIQKWMNGHNAWRAYEPFARLAIASDFTGPNEYISTETLLLAARLGIAFVPLDRARFNPGGLAQQKALLWCDAAPVPAAAGAWVEQGGTLIAMPAALKEWRTGAVHDDSHPRFRIHRMGRGRIAAARAEFDDPWVLAKDAHLLMSRRHDAIRLFNAGSVQHRHAYARGRHIVHLLNYTLRASANQTAIQMALPVRAARLHVPGEPAVEIVLSRELGGLETYVHAAPVYTAVEFEE
jgi:hypothetical protein